MKQKGEQKATFVAKVIKKPFFHKKDLNVQYSGPYYGM